MALSCINSELAFTFSAVRSSFFAQRVINVWISLPSSVDFSTLGVFKRSFQHSFIHSNFKQVNSIKQSGTETIMVI